MDASRRLPVVLVGLSSGLLHAACTANPPVPQPAPVTEAAPVVEEAPPVVEAAPVIEAPPPIVAPPVPMVDPATLTVHAVLLADMLASTSVDALPSGHVLFQDEYHFAVYPAGGSAATELHPLPSEIIKRRFAELEELDEDYDGGDTTLETLGGAWPDLFYATVEETEMRGATARRSLHWKDGAWAEVESPSDGKSYTLSVTYERFMPWVKGRYIVERGLSCTEGCPSEEEVYDEESDAGPSPQERKEMREIDRKIERFKPLAVVGGKATPLPELPDDAHTWKMLSLVSGDIWLPRRSGTIDRWNLTTKAWQPHTIPTGLGKTQLMAGTSKGAAYFGSCEPEALVKLEDGKVTPIPLPEAGCMSRMVVDKQDTLWLVIHHPGILFKGSSTIWRLQGDAWQRVDIAPIELPGGQKRWGFDSFSWTEVEIPRGSFAVMPYDVLPFGTGEVWVYGRIEVGDDKLDVVAREQGGLLPFDMRTVPPPFDDAESCVIQYARLGTLAAGEDPAKAWPAIFNYLAELTISPPGELDSPDPQVFEVDEEGTRAFYVTFGEMTPEGQKAVGQRLTAALPGVGEIACGLSPQPTREHALPEVEEEPDEAGEAEQDGAPAEAKLLEVKLTETKPTELRPTEVKKAEVKPTEVKKAAPTTEVKPAEAKPTEVKKAAPATEVKPAEAKKAAPALPGVND
jgi:hypothetical protein